MGKRESFSCACYCSVSPAYGAWFGLQYVIVIFSDLTQLLFYLKRRAEELQANDRQKASGSIWLSLPNLDDCKI